MKNIKRRKIGIITIERPWERGIARRNGTSRHWLDRFLHVFAALFQARRQL